MSKFITKIIESFDKEKPDLIIKSPGRINLIGEHTDYNDGLALPAAIEQSIYAGISTLDTTGNYTVTALDKNETLKYSLNNSNLFPSGSWQNYVIGVVQEIQKTGKQLSSFELKFLGNIPQGAGLSSSAALENAIVFGLNELFDLNFSKEEMIVISQKAEHNYAGVQCGIMDQYTSMFGEKDTVLKLDFMDNSSEKVECILGDFELILINSNVRHELASSEYNERRRECESALKKIQSNFPDVTSYRDVNRAILSNCKELFTENEEKRANYLDRERLRVLKALDSFQSGSLHEFGVVLFEAHEDLKNAYEVTCAETDWLVKKAFINEHLLGARQMGGGFGGCTINLVKKGMIELYFNEQLLLEYQQKFNKELTLIPVEIGNGTEIIWKK